MAVNVAEPEKRSRALADIGILAGDKVSRAGKTTARSNGNSGRRMPFGNHPAKLVPIRDVGRTRRRAHSTSAISRGPTINCSALPQNRA
jgi:hypothetical protein